MIIQTGDAKNWIIDEILNRVYIDSDGIIRNDAYSTLKTEINTLIWYGIRALIVEDIVYES
jgi:hypothetical protein